MKVLKATGLAIAAAALYALSTPFSKILLDDVSPTMMASLLYLGAWIGLLLVSCAGRAIGHHSHEAPLDRSDLRTPWHDSPGHRRARFPEDRCHDSLRNILITTSR